MALPTCRPIVVAAERAAEVMTFSAMLCGRGPPREPDGATRRAIAEFDARTGAATQVGDSTTHASFTFLPFQATPLPPPARAAAPFFADGVDGVDVVVGAAGVSLLAAILGALAYFKGWFAPLFTRLQRTEVLDNDLRRNLYDAISRDPGMHLNALVEHTRAGNGAVVYHLNPLEKQGLVRSVELPGYRRYFVTGSASPRAMRALAELRAGSAQSVYDIVRGSPGQILRLEYRVPPGAGFVVGDIRIGGRRIEWGGQIAEHVTCTVGGVAGTRARG